MMKTKFSAPEIVHFATLARLVIESAENDPMSISQDLEDEARIVAEILGVGLEEE